MTRLTRSRRLPAILTTLLLVLAATVWTGASCEREEERDGSDLPVNGATRATRAAADDQPVEVNTDGLTEEEKLDLMARIDRERTWWRSLKNPNKPDERYEYMQRMLRSMEFFIDAGAWQLVTAPLRAQAERRKREPVFLALQAFLNAHVPPPAGTPDGRREAIRMLQEALAIDSTFAHGHYLLGRVLMIREMASGNVSPDAIREAAERIQKALEYHKSFPDVHRYLAMAYAQLGDAQLATKHGRLAIDLDGANDENWVIYLRVLIGLNSFSELDGVPQMIRELQPPPDVQYQAYSLLADHFARTNQFQKSWESMQMALAAAMTEPGMIRRETEWVQLYATIGRLALFKPRPDAKAGFGYLREAADHARRHRLPMIPVIASYTQALGALERNPGSEDVQARLGELLELCFEAQGNQALSDLERSNISQVIANFLGKAELAAFERHKLWFLLDWTVEQVASGNEALLNLSIKMIQALLPIADDDEGRAHIDPDHLMDADDDTLKGIVQVLTTLGLESTAFRISYPSAEMLGHLLTATAGRYDPLFIERATDILGRASTSDQNTRKESVCRVLDIHPVESLAAGVISSLEKVVESDDPRACRSLFKFAHPALNSIVGEDEQIRPGWAPDGDTKMDEYRALLALWKRQ